MLGQVGTNRSSHPKADDIEYALRAAGTARGKYQASAMRMARRFQTQRVGNGSAFGEGEGCTLLWCSASPLAKKEQFHEDWHQWIWTCWSLRDRQETSRPHHNKRRETYAKR